MPTDMEDQEITLAQGAVLTAAFRTASPDDTILAEVSGRAIIEKILSQPGCHKIRIYKGLDSTGKPSNVLVGVDADGNDIVEGVLGNRSVKTVGSANVLNS